MKIDRLLLWCIGGHVAMGCIFICCMNAVGHQQGPSLHVKTVGDYRGLDASQRQDMVRLLERHAYGRSRCMLMHLERADASVELASLDRLCQRADACLVPVELHVQR